MSTRPSLLVAILVVAGCRASGPVTGQSTVTPPTREPVLAPESTREVVAKRTPDTFVARDGSACRVGAAPYEQVQLGTQYRCHWIQPSGAPGA